jgi:protein-disulfide isomerase
MFTFLHKVLFASVVVLVVCGVAVGYFFYADAEDRISELSNRLELTTKDFNATKSSLADATEENKRLSLKVAELSCKGTWQDNVCIPPSTSKSLPFRAVDTTDHILGSRYAEVYMIEYSDPECPFCKTYQSTLHQVMQRYSTSQVAWVYRPFPLTQIHSKALQESEAAECAGEQGGSASFFAYMDRLYAITPSNNGLDAAELPVIAKDIGLNVGSFTTCLNSGKYASKIQASYKDAIAAGAQGTPFTVFMRRGSSESVSLAGAQPLDSVVTAVDALLQ